MSLLDSLPHRCTIQRLKYTKGTLAGSKSIPIVEQTNVACWEQQAGASEISSYQKRGISISRKIYFASDPNVTERHQIIITKRNGVAIVVANQIVLDVRTKISPDASAGLGALFKIMVEEVTSDRT